MWSKIKIYLYATCQWDHNSSAFSLTVSSELKERWIPHKLVPKTSIIRVPKQWNYEYKDIATYGTVPLDALSVILDCNIELENLLDAL